MCDGNSVEKLLSQFLVCFCERCLTPQVTDDYRLILNDLDALPEVNRKKHLLIKCGHREIHPDSENYIPPEQLWPFLDHPFTYLVFFPIIYRRDGDMPPYDEKTDVWKSYFVVARLLGSPCAS
jgi:glycoprotein-mannosyl O6-kinase